VKTVDFVMVNIDPSKEAVANGPAAGAFDVESKYNAEVPALEIGRPE
jgi:hypothetical protein